MEENEKQMNIDRRPIVVFDSGVGGISVLREMVKLMPNEDFIYFGDSANAPYGTRTLEEVRALTIGHISRMVEQGAKAVALACNTATSAAVNDLRAMYPDMPVIGIEPALKPAALSGGHPNVVVMATPMTLREQKFHALMERFEDTADIFRLPCPDLVEFVEQGVLDGPRVEEYLRGRFDTLGGIRVDCVVLGCTHFPFAREVIQRVAGPQARLFDGGEGTARQMRRRLLECGIASPEEQVGSVCMENSAQDDSMLALSWRLLRA